jgi:hypothetical protein
MISSRLVLGTISENAGTPVEVVVKMHDYVTLHKDANSVDKIVDKDPTNQHETTAESEEDKLEDIVAFLNCYVDKEETAGNPSLRSDVPSLRSDVKYLLKLVAEVKVLQPLSSNVQVQLALSHCRSLIASLQERDALQQQRDALQQQRDANQQQRDANQQQKDALLSKNACASAKEGCA